jgi:hypothetical protein
MREAEEARMESVESSAKGSRARRRTGVVIVFVLLAIVGWATFVVFDLIRREQASDRLLAAIETTPTGGVLDVATAYDIPWDRAVVVGPYWNGDTANGALGFDHFPPDASLTSGEGASLLLMVRDRTVLSEIQLWQAEATFDEAVEQFTPDEGRFTVVWQNGWATLVHE